MGLGLGHMATLPYFFLVASHCLSVSLHLFVSTYLLPEPMENWVVVKNSGASDVMAEQSNQRDPT